MSNVTTLDVSGYARLWRLFWWSQRFLFAFSVMATVLIGALLLFHVVSGLDALLAEFNAKTLADTTRTDDQKAATMSFEGELLGVAKIVFGRHPQLSILVTVGFLFLALSSIRSSGRFGIRMCLANIAVLILLVGILAWGWGVAGRAAGIEIKDEFLQLLSPVAAALFVTTLAVQAAMLTMLIRHQLAEGLPVTRTMTRSLSSNLTFSLPRIAGFSIGGICVHATVVTAVVAVLLAFPVWIFTALVFGVVDLAMLSIEVPLTAAQVTTDLLQGRRPDAAFYWKRISTDLDDSAQLMVLFAGALAAVGAWRYGMRLNRRRRDAIILKDKPPVLLLRSFKDDFSGIRPNNIVMALFRRRKRLEECLGEELAAAGPFVAVGKPGESLPPLGAQRLYLADDKWQGVVKSYIDRADLIVLIAGTTRWVRWELSSIMQQSQLDRLLIVFPPTRHDERAARWENLRPAFDGTVWEEAARAINVSHSLMAFATQDGRLVHIEGRTGRESDYEAAFRVATYLMRRTSS